MSLAVLHNPSPQPRPLALRLSSGRDDALRPTEPAGDHAVDWDVVARAFGLPDFVGPWSVLHVKSRQEKALAKDLQTLRIPHFLPLHNSTRFYNGRKAKVQVPLFPGYLFLRGPAEQAYAADRTRRVVSIIKVADPRRLSWELQNLALAISQGAQLDPYPGLVPGVRVRLTGGPFRGLQGTVDNRQHLDRVFLQVAMLGASVSLEVDASLVEVLHD